MDRFACLKTFGLVAERGSFAAAASDLGLTPAMVGRQIGWLEERLGVALITRTTRRQSLTEAGLVFLERSRAVLAELEAAEESVARMRSAPRGRLRINAPVTFGATLLAPAIPAFLARYPQVHVDLTLNNRVVDLVDEGFDAVIRTGDLADSGLIARNLAPYPLLCCTTPDYLARQGVPLQPRDLERHACLGFNPNARHLDWTFLGPTGGAETVRVTGPFSSDSGQALLAAARGGAGILLQAEALLAEDLRAGRLVPILPGYRPRPLAAHILYAGSRAVPLKLRAFLDFVADRFG